MSRRRGEFEHRTSIFEGAFRAWCYLGQLSPSELFAMHADEFNPLIARDKEGVPLPTVDGRSSAGDDYVYEPLPRTGLAHPFVKAILRPWLGPDSDSEAMELGLTTLRTWWQHRRKGESGTAINALGTDRMRSVVDGYTRHFFTLAHVLIVQEQEQPPRSLQSKIRNLERSNPSSATSAIARRNNRGSASSTSRTNSASLPSALMNNVTASNITPSNVDPYLNNSSAGLMRGLSTGSNAFSVHNGAGGFGHGSGASDMITGGIGHGGGTNSVDLGYDIHQGRGRSSFTLGQMQGSDYGGSATSLYYNTPMDSSINMHGGSYSSTGSHGMNMYGGGDYLSTVTGQYGQYQRQHVGNSSYGLDGGTGSLGMQQSHNVGYSYSEYGDEDPTAKRRRSDHSLSLMNGLTGNPMVAELASYSQASQRAHRGADVSKMLREQVAMASSVDGTRQPESHTASNNSFSIKTTTSKSCCDSKDIYNDRPSSTANIKGISRMPVVFVNKNQDVQIGIEVEGINDLHCVKIIETVLRGPQASNGSTNGRTPIEGLIDAVADKNFNFVLIKIDKSSNAKRIAGEVIRNLSLVGYSAKVKEMAVTELFEAANSASRKQGPGGDLSMLFGAFEAVGSSKTEDVFKWDTPCTCFNISSDEKCPRHSQLTREVFNRFQDREKEVQEYVKGCLMRYGGDCSCDSNCVCPGCPKHDPKVLKESNAESVGLPGKISNTNILAEAAAQVSQSQPRQVKRRSGRVSRTGNRMSFTMRGSEASVGRTMSGLSSISIDWDNMEDFDVNVDHSAGVVHNNLQIMEGCNMSNGGECNCPANNCTCTGCTKHGNAVAAKEEATETAQTNIGTPVGQKRRSSLRKQRDNGKNSVVTNNETTVSFKL